MLLVAIKIKSIILLSAPLTLVPLALGPRPSWVSIPILLLNSVVTLGRLPSVSLSFRHLKNR